MFRMMPKDYAPPAPPDAPPEDASEPDAMEPDGDPDDASQGMDAGGAGKVGAETAGYRDPSQGPFACSNCSHMVGDSQCEILSDPIDPDGLCNLFWSKSSDTSNQDDGSEGSPDEAAGPPQGAGPGAGGPPPGLGA